MVQIAAPCKNSCVQQGNPLNLAKWVAVALILSGVALYMLHSFASPAGVPDWLLPGVGTGGMKAGIALFTTGCVFGVFSIVRAIQNNRINNLKNGETKLHKAVLKGAWDVKVLLFFYDKINPNITNSEDKTPLHLAIENKDRESVEVLMDVPGINLNCVDRQGNTPLHLAAGLDRSDIIALLGNREGVKVSRINDLQETPLHVAALNNSYLAASAILRLRCAVDLNAKNLEGKTALHLAAERGNIGVVEVLVKGGANKTLKDNNFKTPYELAAEKRFPKITGMLSNNPL